MSYSVIDKIIKSSQFNVTEKMVMIALASFGNDDGGSIFPAQKRIAKRASLTTRTLIRTIDKLIESGFLTKQAVSQDNLKRPNKYFINVDAIQCDRESHRYDRESQGCDTVSGGVVTLCQEGSDRESHNPTIDSTINTPPITPPPIVPPKNTRKSKANITLENFFEKNDKYEFRDFCKNYMLEHGYDYEPAKQEYTQFENYWLSEGKTKKDWKATFRTWINGQYSRLSKGTHKQQPFGGSNGKPKEPTNSDILDALVENIEAGRIN